MSQSWRKAESPEEEELNRGQGHGGLAEKKTKIDSLEDTASPRGSHPESVVCRKPLDSQAKAGGAGGGRERSQPKTVTDTWDRLVYIYRFLFSL